MVFTSVGASHTIADDEEELKQVRQELIELTSQLSQFRAEQDQQLSDRRTQELELSKLHRQIFDSKRNITRIQKRLTQLDQQSSTLEKKRRLQNKALLAELRAMYIAGNEEPIKMLLNQENPERFSRMLSYYRFLLRARSKKIDEFRELIAKISDTQQKIGSEKLALIKSQKDLDQQSIELNASLARRDRLLQKIGSKIQTAEQKMANREQDAKQLEQLIADALKRIARLQPQEDHRPFGKLKGKFNWPVTGKISSKYGNHDRQGGLANQGVILSSTIGSDVAALHSGRVVFSDYMRGYGLLIIIDHDENYMTLYGHNQSLFVEPGDWVKPGERIALVGKSSEYKEPGLYFEIRHKGKPQNPSHWCR